MRQAWILGFLWVGTMVQGATGDAPTSSPASSGAASKSAASLPSRLGRSQPAAVELAAEIRRYLHKGEARQALQVASQVLPAGLSAPFHAKQLVQDNPQLAALLARAAQANNREDVALPIYDALYWRASSAGDRDISARLAIRLADVLVQAGHPDEGAHWYLKADTTDMMLRATLGRARALRLGGHATQALITVQQADPAELPLEHSLRPALLAEAAQCAKAAGRQELRRRLLVLLWSQHPGANLRYPSASRLDKHEKPYSGMSQTLLQNHAGPGGVVQRAEGLLAGNMLDGALELVAGKVFVDAKLRCRAGYVEGKALRNKRRYSSARKALDPVLKNCPEQAGKALYLLGRVATFQKQYEKALGFFDRFAAAYPNDRLTDDVLFFAGTILTMQKRHSEATRYYQRVVDDFAEADYHEEAQWRLAWGAHLAKDDQAAIEQLDAIARTTASRPDGKSFQRAVYWRSRLSLGVDQLGADKKDAIDDLDSMLRADPVSYYAAQARSLLHRVAPQRGRETDAWLVQRAQSAAAAPAVVPTLPAIPEAQLGGALLQAGLDEEAREAFNTIDFTSLQLGHLIAVAHQLLRSGDTHAAHWMIRKRAEQDLVGLPDPKEVALWRAGFALGYADYVHAWAQKRTLDPAMVFALIREESAFEAPVVSWAGAVGLMQLMPFTAKEEAGLDKMSNFTLSQLTDPDVNIRLGTAHIARRIGTYSGNHALAIAAYNAGPGNVNAWLRKSPEPQLDAYIEAIPVEQTRNYTKRVLRSWLVYRFLYYPDAPWIDLWERAI